MALGGEVVDFVRLGFLHDADEVGCVRHVAVMQDEAWVFLVRILIDVFDAAGVEGRRTALDAVDDIALIEQQLSQVSTILAGDAGNEGYFCFFGHRLAFIFSWRRRV